MLDSDFLDTGEPATTDGDDDDDDDSDDTVGDDPMTDLPDDPPAGCSDEVNDLQLEWNQADPSADRAGAVAVGTHSVAWTAGGFGGLQLRVLEHDGTLRWEQVVDAFPGEAELAMQDLAVGPEDQIALVATVSGTQGFDGLLQWYDAEGQLLGTHVHATETFDIWQGVAFLDDGDLIAVGDDGDNVVAKRYAPGAVPVWTQAFAGPGSLWGSDVAVMPSGRIVASGHSNAIPGPVLVAFDGDGIEQWMFQDGDGSQLDIAMSVAVDEQDRAWMTVSEESGSGRVELFSQGGNLEATLPLDFSPNAIAVAPDGGLVVAGRDIGQDLVVVERRSAEWELRHRYERPGRWAMGVAVDAQCHAYVVGSDMGGGAWLEKLR